MLLPGQANAADGEHPEHAANPEPDVLQIARAALEPSMEELRNPNRTQSAPPTSQDVKIPSSQPRVLQVACGAQVHENTDLYKGAASTKAENAALGSSSIDQIVEIATLASAETSKSVSDVPWTTAAWCCSFKDQSDPENREAPNSLLSVIADALNAPIFENGQADPHLQWHFIQSLAVNGRRETVRELFSKDSMLEKLTDLVCAELETITTTAAATAEDLNAKFQSGDGTFGMHYAGIETYYAGLEALVGAPNSRVMEAMEEEHCKKANSSIPFTTANYGVTTTPTIEWLFVTNPEAGLKKAGLDRWPEETKNVHFARSPCSLGQLQEKVDALNKRLEDVNESVLLMEEATAGVLYTGPMFTHYNLVCRGGALNITSPPPLEKAFKNMCQNNRYVTTIHAINSLILKLGKLQEAISVYRGLSGAYFSQEFLEEGEDGVRGGIEPAFMSTTSDRRVAMQYASGAVGAVLEMKMGMVDRGADLSPLSQYPHEREICFAPLTGVEVLSKRVERSTLVVEASLSCNLVALTLGEVIAKRYKVLKDMVGNLKKEIPDAFEKCWVQEFISDTEEAAVVRSSIVNVSEARLDEVVGKETKENMFKYNNDVELVKGFTAALAVLSDLRNLQPEFVEAVCGDMIRGKSHCEGSPKAISNLTVQAARRRRARFEADAEQVMRKFPSAMALPNKVMAFLEQEQGHDADLALVALEILLRDVEDLNLTGQKAGNARRWDILAECLEKHAPRLRFLRMSNTDIDDDACQSFAKALVTNSNLIQLDIRYTDVGMESWNALAEMLLSNSTVIHLRLCGHDEKRCADQKVKNTIAKVRQHRRAIRTPICIESQGKDYRKTFCGCLAYALWTLGSILCFIFGIEMYEDGTTFTSECSSEAVSLTDASNYTSTCAAYWLKIKMGTIPDFVYELMGFGAAGVVISGVGPLILYLLILLRKVNIREWGEAFAFFQLRRGAYFKKKWP